MGKVPFTWLWFFALCYLTGCGDSGGQPGVADPAQGLGASSVSQPETPAYTELGDLDALKQRGILRVLVHRNTHTDYLPRDGDPQILNEDRLQRFAAEQGMQARLVAVEDFNQLIPRLNAGEGDVIVANLTDTVERREQLAFTVALTHVTQHLVSAKDQPLASLDELKQRILVVQEKTSFWSTAQKLERQFSGLQVQAVPGTLGDDEIFDRVANGKNIVTLADSNVLDIVLAYRDDLHKSGPISAEQPVAWGVRSANSELLADLNAFIIHDKITRPQVATSVEDWPGIVQRKHLRVALPNNSASYFLWGGQLMGFDYELLQHFAEQHKLRLDVVVATEQDQLLDHVRSGRADVAGGFLTPSVSRMQGGIVFSSPYHLSSQVVVAKVDDHTLDTPEQLDGHTVSVRPGTSYWQSILQLQERGIGVQLAAAPEDEETEAAIANVASGAYDLTVADQNFLAIELTWRDDIRAAFTLGEEEGQAWALRANNPQLLKQLNAFIAKEYRGLFYNMAYKKYFKAPRNVAKLKQGQLQLQEQGKLSPYDDLIKKYAEQYQFDWRLIAAQMYQETKFNPHAKSWVGAQGLLQVMPATAREMGVKDMHNPENGIKAGVKYLDHVRKQFPESLPVGDRVWFSLAAYNAGSGHVRDAIALAKQQGLNPDRWFDNVERAMLLLANKKYAAKARHGYVRGQEPVKYVREIRQRFGAYVQLTEANQDK
jgi:membrane-bound lytic murein transglycosylase F